MEKEKAAEKEQRTHASLYKKHALFFVVLLAIIAAAIVRSSIATRLDSFTFDEAYHVGAGAAYIQTGDFRLNPEQPPLTKLWTGAYATWSGYQISPYRSFADKSDEREFVEQDAYEKNDPFALQTQARTAMFALNGLLLLMFGMAVWRVFGHIFATAVTLFLAIDPTVAAHMPVVMTDLPIALTSGAAMVLASRAFRTWNWLDLLLTALALGLALTAKHSGIITLGALAMIGVVMAVAVAKGAGWRVRLRHVGAVAAVAVGAMILLWSFYGFQYRETSGTAEETFNRPLADKISDVKSPVYRAGLNVITVGHLFPRAYIWGLADTIRAGAEGRAIEVRAFGETYYSKAPFYFFPGVIAAKLPIGLLMLCVVGGVLIAARRLGDGLDPPVLIITAFTAIFLAVLITGSTYAGVRHALPLFPFVAILCAATVYVAVRSKNKLAQVGVAALLVVGAASAVPQMRPWEYFNEFAGGTENGYKYFNDEGVDLSQRIGEMANYYHNELEPNGDVPFLAYFSNEADRKARGMDWVGHDRERDDPKFEQKMITGTFMIGANELGERTWWDVGKPFRGVQPVVRFGNVFVFRGTFERSNGMAARRLFYRALYTKVYVDQPDAAGAISLIEKSIDLDDSSYFVSLELGNLYLTLGNRQKALEAYRRSYEKAPRTDSIYDVIAEQIKRVETEPLEALTGVRNPGIE